MLAESHHTKKPFWFCTHGNKGGGKSEGQKVTRGSVVLHFHQWFLKVAEPQHTQVGNIDFPLFFITVH